MSQQPPQRPNRAGQQPAKRPTPARTAAAGSPPVAAGGQQAMQSKSRQAAQGDAGDEEDFEEEESFLNAWLRQSPSWLTSMVVHLILFLVLMLIPLAGELEDAYKELEIGKPDIVEEEELVQEDTNESLNEKLDTDVESDSEEEVDEISPLDNVVDAEMLIKTDQDDMSLAAAKVDFSDFATEVSAQGDLLSDLGGVANSGLGSRTNAGRAGAVRQGGGNKGSETAVEAALKWLADHQNRDGSWSWAHTAGDRCSGFANPGASTGKMGPTGLALLPFLGAGYTHREGKYKYVVENGLKYLVGKMAVANNAGRLFEGNGPDHEHMYSHGISACALAEAYGMTQDPKLKAPAQLALNYIVQAQHPENGGWLYTPRAGGDTSVVGWQIMALKSGILSYLQVPGNVKTLANKWLDFVQSEVPPGGYGVGSRYGYRNKDDRGQTAATTAIGLICRNYLGTKKEDPGLRLGVQNLGNAGPELGNMYHVYYGSMVMYQNDGPDGKLWKSWNLKMRDGLINTQVKDGKDGGSWHFGGGHGGHGGRVYNTAMAAMTLEVYYRYMPVYQKHNVEQDDFPLE